MAKKPTSNDPANWLELPDVELGYLLLAQFAAEQARVLGLPVEGMTAEYRERVRRYVLTLQADKASLAAAQVALHAVASGDPERAGRLYRQLLLDGATHLRFENFAIGEQQRLKAARSKGGKVTAETKREKSQVSAIVAKAKEYKRVGKEMPEHEVAGKIAGTLKLSVAYVRRVLVREGLVPAAATAGKKPTKA